MNRPLNAFQTVRPRGNATMPSAVQRPRATGAAPGLLRGSVPCTLAMDTNGRRCVPIAPRANGNFLIESGAAAQASVDKRSALLKGGI
jgi:hypothetical protein